MAHKPGVWFKDLGHMDYDQAWDMQEKLLQTSVGIKTQNRTHPELGKITPENYLLFCEHNPVYTLGKSGKPEHLLLNPDQLKEKGIQYYPNNRGGDITYHGPGQITGYPIFDLEQFTTDINLYLRNIEESVIRTLAEIGIEAGRYPGYTGVWIDPEGPAARKICAIGIRCSRWVTMHGFAFNVNTDLKYFSHIIPCGIDDKAVSSVASELGREADMQDIKRRLQKQFAEVFGFEYISEPLIHGASILQHTV